MQSNGEADVHRPTAKFHPSPWDDFFITHVFQSDEVVRDWNERIEALKPEVVRMLIASEEPLSEKLNLVDVIQRLGLGYHFEEEIQRLLQQVYADHCSTTAVDHHDYDLCTTSLCFRLLRQHGYDVSTDIFRKFMTEEGKFQKEIAEDMEGMLSLYEAGYMRKRGESVLDEAIDFTKSHLNSAAMATTELDSSLADRISHALERPLHKGVAKVEQLFFISVYEQMNPHDETLLTLAKLSYNVIQNMYQNELKVLTKWWIDSDLKWRLPYARDKLIEVYFWAIGTMWEPKFSMARYTFTIVTVLCSLYDDTYDAYGTIQELEMFTAAIERWDISMKGVNHKMKILFEATVTTFDILDVIASKEGQSYCSEYAKLSLKNMVKMYLAETRWFAESYVPTLEEYRGISSLSTTYQSMVFGVLCGLGELGSREVFDWLFTNPKIFVASGDQCRLMDDIASHKFEQERGHSASSVECYMTHYEVTRDEAVAALNKIVEEDWKIVNEELLNPKNHYIPKEVLSLFLGYERMMDILYKYSDCYTFSNTWTKDLLTTLLVTPLPIN